HQRSKHRPEQLPNPPQIEIERYRQGNRCRPQQNAEDLGTFAVFGVGQAATDQYADHQQHRHQHRLQKYPSGFLERRQHQLVGAQGNAYAKQRVMNDRRQGPLPIEGHWVSSRRAWRLTNLFISTPTKAMEITSDNTSAPTI